MNKKLLALILALTLALSLAACGGGSKEEDGGTQKEINLTGFYNAQMEKNEWPALMALEGEMLDGFYPGLSELSAKQCLVYAAAMSAAVGEIALVETETEEDAAKAAEIFQARIDYQVGDDENPGGAWYPETIEGWKNKSQIVSHGNYVMLAVGDSAGDAAEDFDALFA